MDVMRAERGLSLSHAVLLSALLLACLGFTQLAKAADEPQLKPPSFPLEPGKKKPKPIDPKTYVEGADAPPLSEADRNLIPRLVRNEAQWWTLFQLGWFYGSTSASHAFSAPTAIPTYGSVRRTNHNLLNLAGLYEARAPRLPLSLALSGSFSYGTAEAGLPLAIENVTRFNSQNYRGALGLRGHLLKRRSPHVRRSRPISLKSTSTIEPSCISRRKWNSGSRPRKTGLPSLPEAT
jgi:hypothetical protein